jgi:hypothetical protein
MLSELTNPQTETPEFKRWFRSSKVVNDDGTPMVVFHGTYSRDFNRFGEVRNTGLFYFSENPDYTRAFSLDASKGEADKYPAVKDLGPQDEKFFRGRTIPAYLSIQNPIYADSLGVRQITFKGFFNFISKWNVNGQDLLKLYSPYGEAVSAERIDAYYRKKNSFWQWLKKPYPFLNEVADFFLENGYDGVYMLEDHPSMGWKKGVPTWVAFKNTQIKSAIGNKGTFDPDREEVTEIRSELNEAMSSSAAETESIPQTESPQFKRWFKNSVVVDENGEPLLMRHGSVSEFDIFDKSKIRVDDYDAPFNGFWFTSDDWASPAFTSPKYTKEVYLSVQNPAPWQVWRKVSKEVENYYEEYKSKGARGYGDTVRMVLQDMGYDGVIWEGKPNVDLSALEKDSRVEFETLRGNKYELRKNKELGGVDLYSNCMGHITGYNDAQEYLSLQETVVVVFEPNQIKSARNNNGNFDPSKDSINEVLDEKVIYDDTIKSPNFKRWFKNSKVVDNKGNPLVMYHLSKSEEIFTEFLPFSHFGTVQATEEIMGDEYEYLKYKVKDGPFPQKYRTYPVYLSIRKPIVLTDIGSEPREQLRLWTEEANEQNALSARAADEIDYESKHDIRYANSLFIKRLKAKGYDGIVYENVEEDPGSLSWVIFDPSQAKSIFAKEFNPNSGDIREDNMKLTEGDVIPYDQFSKKRNKELPVSSLKGSKVDDMIDSWTQASEYAKDNGTVIQIGTKFVDDHDMDEFSDSLKDTFGEEVDTQYEYEELTRIEFEETVELWNQLNSKYRVPGFKSLSNIADFIEELVLKGGPQSDEEEGKLFTILSNASFLRKGAAEMYALVTQMTEKWYNLYREKVIPSPVVSIKKLAPLVGRSKNILQGHLGYYLKNLEKELLDKENV